MTANYEIFLGTPEDIPGVLTLQEANMPHNGGNLSVRFSADWFQRAIDEKSLVVCRREGEIVGYVLGTSFGLKDPAAIGVLPDKDCPSRCRGKWPSPAGAGLGTASKDWPVQQVRQSLKKG